jgi:amino acid adenylation domain-containing protein
MRALLAKLRENNVFLSLENDNLKLSYNDPVIDPKLIDEIKRNKSELILFLHKNKESKYVPIEKAAYKPSYPLTSTQFRIWYLSQLDDVSKAYNINNAIRLRGKLNEEKFIESFKYLIKRYEILRTSFKPNELGEVRQFVLPAEEVNFQLNVVDFSQENNEDVIVNYISSLDDEAFDLENSPLIRATLLKEKEDEHILVVTLHHIVSDGWSMQIIMNDLIEAYGTLINGITIKENRLNIQYKDYAEWCNTDDYKSKNKLSESYWLKKFSGDLQSLILPSLNTRPLVQTFNGKTLNHTFSNDFLTKLKTLSVENNSTLFMTLMAGIKVLLHKYSSQNDIIVGTPIAGREHPDLEDQVGLFINTLPIRSKIEKEDTFLSFLKKERETLIEAYEHQDYPFDKLVNKLDLPRDDSRSALFDVFVVLQNQGQLQSFEQTVSTNELEFENYELANNTSQFDLCFLFVETEGLNMEVVYNTDIYDARFIQSVFNHFESLFDSVSWDSEQLIENISFLSTEEKHELLVTFNDTQVDHPTNKTLVDLFEDQVAITPCNVAVVFEEKELTYNELNERSNQLADYLRSNYKIQPDDLVGVKLERSEQMIVTIMGVLKSGGAYVPIDPEYPQERIDYIIEDSGCKVLIDKDTLLKFKEKQGDYTKKNLSRLTAPEDLAYVIYTSGSTGQPKGVIVENRSIVNSTISRQQVYENVKSFLLLSSFSFDSSIASIFSSLSSGAILHLISKEKVKNPVEVSEYIRRNEISHLLAVPSYYNLLIPELGKLENSLKQVIVAGELYPDALVTRHFNADGLADCDLFNEYGPTECSVWSTVYKHENSDEVIQSIGKPIDNAQIYITNDSYKLAPNGVIGEILIGGAGLARGYLNNPELTSEKFVANPFVKGERLYKTGDLGKWLPDGNLAFIGRKDDQVKIRGYRIELGEIENTLLQGELVDEAIVLAKEDATGDKNLVAYVMSKEELNSADLRKSLSKQLPDCMVPSYFVQLEKFPLTPNGKVDKKALSSPDGLGMITGVEYVEPRNELEEKLVAIWEDVLGREKIGVRDNFFDIGGHSLKATRLVSSISQKLEIKLTLKEILTRVTVEDQAILLKQSVKTHHVTIDPVHESEGYAISDAQRRLWILSQFKGGSVAYNMPFQLTLDGDYNIESFKLAIEATIDRHEILRTIFKEDDQGEVRQWILSREDLAFEIDYQDYRLESNKNDQVEAYITNDSNTPFDLTQGPLLRVALLQVEEDKYVFYYNMHHIISDGWSIEVLTKEILIHYKAYKANEEPDLVPMRIQYKDYSAWQLAQLEGEPYQLHKSYWLEQLSGELPVLELPTSKQRPLLKTNNGRILGTYISKEDSLKLKEFSQSKGGSLFMGVVASLNALFYRYTDQENFIIGSPIAGREHADLEDQIGFYVNTLALRNQVNGSGSFEELLVQVKQSTLNAYNHQAYPFDRLVEDLDLRRDTSRSALFDVMVSSQSIGEKIDEVNISEEELATIVDYGEGISKFDIEFTFEEVGDYISFSANYNTDVYDKEIITQFITHYKNILQSILISPGDPIDEANFLSEEEEHQLLYTFNDTAVNFPKNKTLIDLFEEQVVNTPDNVAVVFDEVELTYKDLNEQSNQLANYLRSNYKIQADDLVGIKLDRSEQMIIAILGTLKSGAAYVPIDPGYPQDRIDYMIEDSGCKVLIDQEELNNFKDQKSTFASENLPKITSPYDLAYVIYTSGSTGKSKGVEIQSSSLINYCLLVNEDYFNSQSGYSIGLITSLTFDLSLTTVFPTLLRGDSIVIYVQDNVEDLLTSGFLSNLRSIKLTPSHLSVLEDLSLKSTNVEICIVGGEELKPHHVSTLKKLNKNIKIINEYGPTETTIGVSTKIIDKNSGVETSKRISIGSPISNTQFYIVDEQTKLVPQGVTGEICISGAGLARGYLNRPKLTAEKFVVNPFVEGTRMYKTGDLGRWLSNGDVEFIGRRDDQVKIRGYRIELGEIESVLKKNILIEESIVLTDEDANGDKILIAYVVSKEDLTSTELLSYLKGKLPDYMLPSHFVQIKELPLTSNGKLDKKALPSPDGLGMSTGVEYKAPTNDAEQKIVDLWEDVLGKAQIGLNDDFFTLGGHSLKAIQLLNGYNKFFNVKLSINDLFENTTLISHAALINQATTEVYEEIEVIEENASYPLSDAQRRLWVLSQFENGSLSYNLQSSIDLASSIEIEKLEKAINATIDRHEILRTVFRVDELGNPRQFILSTEELNFNLEYQDISDLLEKESLLSTYFDQDKMIAFDLENGPLIRACIFKVDEEHYLLYYNMHHIISDGWSAGVLKKNILAFYQAFSTNFSTSFPDLRIQYKDYASWQLSTMEKEEFQVHKSYWTNLITNDLPVISWKGNNVRPKMLTNNGKSMSTFIDAETTLLLKDFVKQSNGTLFMGLLSSWNALFHLYTGNTDIIIGSPVAGRDHSDLADQIGFYVNTLALRTAIDSKESFQELFGKVKEQTLEAYEHQMYPFDKLVEDANVIRDTSRSAIFDVLLTLQNFEDSSKQLNQSKHDTQLISDNGNCVSKFDLELSFEENGDCLEFDIVFNQDIYKEEVIVNLINHFKQLLSALLNKPTAEMGALNYLSTSENNELIELLNNTDVDAPVGKTIVELFEEQVERNPTNVALIFEGKQLSYGDLNEKSNQLANFLRDEYSVKPDDLIGIKLDKSEWVIVSILGILKSGGAYVPIDIDYPQERIDYIERDSKCVHIITESELTSFSNKHAEYSLKNLEKINTPNDLAYVMYTSGTTGNPKGVMVENQNVVRLACPGSYFPLNNQNVLLSTGAFSFDATIMEYFGTLLNGSKLILAQKNDLLDFGKLKTILNKEKVNTLWMTASWFNEVVDADITIFESIERLIVGGDIVSPYHVHKVISKYPSIKAVNGYGPTENTTFSLSYNIEGDEKGSIPIGKPINNSYTYVLNDHLMPTPVNVEGTIYVSGLGLSRGYLNNPELTEEKFIDNPYRKGEKMFNTGDVGRRLEDGNIEFVGRHDDQVKIRGYRIELEEITNQLLEKLDISSAVVVAKENAEGEKELVGYVVSENEQTFVMLNSFLREKVPIFMLPSQFVQVDKMPLTPNGKIDIEELPDPKSHSVSLGSLFVEPRNETEIKLTQIWKEILKKEQVGINDNFFDLGGNSISALKAIHKINETFGYNFTLNHLFNAVTIEKIAEVISVFDESKIESNEVKDLETFKI